MNRVAMPVQTGKVIDYTNSGADKIKSGDIVPMVNMCGVAETDIEVGAKGAVAISEVWDVPAVSGAVFNVGDLLYWNGTQATKTSTGNPSLGVAVAPKATSVIIARVKLCVFPAAASAPTP